MVQTQEQIQFQVQEWEARYKNPNLLSTDHNINEITGWLNRNKGGEITIQNLIEATQSLGDIDAGGRLQYHKAPQTVVVEVERQKSPRELELERIQAARMAGIDVKVRTEWDKTYEKKVIEPKAAYVPAPFDPTLPEVPKGCAVVPNTKQDIDNIPHDVYRNAIRGPHGRALTKRVSVILQRHAATQAAAAAEAAD